MSDGEGATGAGAEAAAEAPQHIPKDQLFALTWAILQDPPPEEGEGADPELRRTLRALGDHYQQGLAAQFRLGPETVTRYLEHQRSCDPCRMLLVEDSPDARPPKTEAEKEAEVQRAEDRRKGQVIKFFKDLALGVGGFAGAQFCYVKYQQKRFAKMEEGARMEAKEGFKVDPLMMGFMALLLFAAWFLAEAWVGARELGWFDLTAWKRAVPVVGKKWAEKSGKQQDGG